MKRQLTHSRLLELLNYDPDTGIFIRKIRAGAGKAGDIAGTLTSRGYVHITIDYKIYRANILAWFYVTGSYPSNQIDHKDTIRKNNKFDNLREITHTGNMQNRKSPSKNNKSGFLGVAFNKKYGNYTAFIRANGKNINLGTYKNPEDAHDAYVKEKRNLHTACTI